MQNYNCFPHIIYNVIILQDADVSRNIPGKAKVSAPNINRIKKK
jgi:hypothetical protein